MGITQEQFAELFDIIDRHGNPSKDKVWTYENDRAKPTDLLVNRICDFVGISVDAVKNQPLAEKNFNVPILKKKVENSKIGIRGTSNPEIEEPNQPYLTQRFNQKMSISTYMVPLVPIKAQAGYITSHELTDFIEKLEKFPMAPGINPRGAEWRWFEVAGESMEPTLYEGDYILCSMVPQEDWSNLENYYMYCIVTVGNMWVKRIVKKGRMELVLHSDNKKVKQRIINLEEVREIWKVRRHLNARMPSPEKIVVTI